MSNKYIKLGFDNQYHKCAEESFGSGLSTIHQSYEHILSNPHDTLNALNRQTFRATRKARFELIYPSMSNNEYNLLQSLFAQHIRDGSWYNFIPNHRFVLDANNYMYSVRWGIIDRTGGALPSVSASTISLGDMSGLTSVNSAVLYADTYTMANMNTYMMCKFSLHHINYDEVSKMDQSYSDIVITNNINHTNCPYSGGTDTDIIERIGIDVVGYGVGILDSVVTYGLDVYVYDYVMSSWAYVGTTDAPANGYLSYSHVSKIFDDGTTLSNMISDSKITLLIISRYPSGTGGVIGDASGVALNYCRVFINGYKVMVDHQGSSYTPYNDRSYAIQVGDPFVSTETVWDDYITDYRTRTNTDVTVKGPLSYAVTLKLEEI